MTAKAPDAHNKQLDAGTALNGGAEKTFLTAKFIPADSNISNQRRSIINKVKEAKKKNNNEGQPSLFDALTKAERAVIHTENLDKYLSLAEIPAEARALHRYIKTLFIAADIESVGEKFSKIVCNAHGEMYSIFTKKAYSTTNRVEHQDYHRKILRWTEALTEHAHLKFRTDGGTSGISGNIYPRIELDAKSGNMNIYIMREYVDENKAHGINYDILPEALYIMANGTHIGALAYDYIFNYFSNRRNPKNADGTLRYKITMKTLIDNCGVQNLDEAKKHRHQMRDVKEPIINGLAEHKKAKTIDYILTLHGQKITDAEAIKLDDKDFENTYIEKIAFPGIPIKKLGKKPKDKQGAEQTGQTEMDFGVNVNVIDGHYTPPETTPGAAQGDS